MNRGKIEQLLKNYRLYKLAIRDYQKAEKPTKEEAEGPYMVAAPARVTMYSDTPVGQGSGSKPPQLTGVWGMYDYMEYHAYRYAVERVDAALHLLSEKERRVVVMRWMDGMNMKQIGKEMNYSRENIKKIHLRAIEKLSKAMRFDQVPPIKELKKTS